MSNLLSGVFLMVVGMGTVYLFLALLIGVTEVIRIVWGERPAPPTPPAPPRAAADDETLRAAVVTAALLHHRRPR
jgi:oxaloacetate decarboxylase (Na+ extruding) subunit gamma